MTETLDKLGKLVTEDDAHRDAVHIAVAPVIAGEDLEAGDRVGIMPDGSASSKAAKLVGIVDPYLLPKVRKGQKFWVFLFPQTITSLRHHWQAPDFPGADSGESREVQQAREWLHEQAGKLGVEYKELVESAESGEGMGFGTTEGPDIAYSDEFWRAVEKVTGKKFSAEHRANTSYHCAC